MTNDEYDAQFRAKLKPIEARPDVERAERMAEELDINTYTRIDYAIRALEDGRRLTSENRRDFALLLRRLRKQQYGSALTDAERRDGRVEINP